MRRGVRGRHDRADMDGRQFRQMSGWRQAYQRKGGRQAKESREGRGTLKPENSLKGIVQPLKRGFMDGINR